MYVWFYYFLINLLHCATSLLFCSLFLLRFRFVFVRRALALALALPARLPACLLQLPLLLSWPCVAVSVAVAVLLVVVFVIAQYVTVCVRVLFCSTAAFVAWPKNYYCTWRLSQPQPQRQQQQQRRHRAHSRVLYCVLYPFLFGIFSSCVHRCLFAWNFSF